MATVDQEAREDEIDRLVIRYTVRRGARVGVAREDYLRDLGKIMHGISYAELRKSLHRLMERGLVTMQMIGADEFIVKPAQEALDLLDSGRITDVSWQKAASGPIQCRKCDSEMAPGARFCTVCGNVIAL